MKRITVLMPEHKAADAALALRNSIELRRAHSVRAAAAREFLASLKPVPASSKAQP